VRRGFSLLEVMVALAIFGLMISGILAAQGGLAASNKKAAHMGEATTLARCKMTELEEKLLKLGYSQIDDVDSDVLCCEGSDTSTFTCDYKVEKVIMPDPPSSTGLDMDGGGVSQLMGMSADGGGAAGGATLDLDGGLSALGSLGGQTGASGAAGLLNMAMGLVYPMMKPMMEASIRKITVTVKWKEGPNPATFVLTQYVTNPQQGGFMGGMPFGMGGDGGAGFGTPMGGPAGGSPFSSVPSPFSRPGGGK
jgi:general secretion pathway protein I